MRRLLVPVLLLVVAGCGESMDNQNRMKTYGAAEGASGWSSDHEALPLVRGTVARGALERDRETAIPPPVSLALLRRGRERYDIYCALCHGLTGQGNGIVVLRGFPQPKPFGDPQQMRLTAKEIVGATSQGYGTMYGFSDRVGPNDRWAIAAYIRALQMADNNVKAPP